MIKKKVLKATEKKVCTYKDQEAADVSLETMRARQRSNSTETNHEPRILNLLKVSFKMKLFQNIKVDKRTRIRDDHVIQLHHF